MAKYLRKAGTGEVFYYTELLAKRPDMVPYNITDEQFRALLSAPRRKAKRTRAVEHDGVQPITRDQSLKSAVPLTPEDEALLAKIGYKGPTAEPEDDDLDDQIHKELSMES